jgi:hypothetical protein
MRDTGRYTGRFLRLVSVSALAVSSFIAFGVAATSASASAACPTLPSNYVCIPAQGGMEGDLKMSAGQTLFTGYNFATGAGATSMIVQGATVSFDLSCDSGTANPAVLTIAIPDQNYSSPFPTNQGDPSTYQGSAVVPDACSGGTVHVGKPNAGPFSAGFFGNGSGTFQVQFHYGTTNNTGHSWSASKSVTAAPLSGVSQAPVLGRWLPIGLIALFVAGLAGAVLISRRQRRAVSLVS